MANPFDVFDEQGQNPFDAFDEQPDDVQQGTSTEDLIPEWGRENPNLWAALATATDMARPIAEGTAYAIPQVINAFTGGTATPAAIPATGALVTGVNEVFDQADVALGKREPRQETIPDALVRGGKNLIDASSNYMLGENIGVGAGKVAIPVGRWVNNVWKSRSRGGAEKEVGDFLLESVTNSDDALRMARIAEDMRSGKTAPYGEADVKLDLGQTTGDPSLSNMSRKFKTRKSGLDGQSKRDNNDAIVSELRRIYTNSSEGEFDDLINALKTTADELDGGVAAAEKQLETGVRGSLGDAKTRVESGSGALEMISNAEQSAYKQSEALYNKIGNPKLSAENVLKAVDDAGKEWSVVDQSGKVPDDVFSDIKKLFKTTKTRVRNPDGITSSEVETIDPNISFSDLRQMRTRVWEEINLSKSVQSDPVGKARVKRLKVVARAINDTLDSLADTPNKEVADAYNAARKFYKEKYFRPFKDRTVGDITYKVQRGSLKESDILDQFFKPTSNKGVPEAADDLISAVGQESAEKLVDDYATRLLLDELAKNDGKANAKTVLKFYDKYGGALDKFPNVKKKFTSTRAMEKKFAEALDSSHELRNTFYESALGKALKAKNPSQRLDAALAKDPIGGMRQLIDAARGSDAAMTGLRREYAKRIERLVLTTDQLGAERQLSQDKLVRLMDRELSAMEMLYTPQQISDMKVLLDTKRRMRFTETSWTSGSDTASKLTDTEGNIDAKSAAGRGMAGFFANSPFVMADAGVKLGRVLMGKINSKILDEVLTEAIVDGKFGAELLRAAKQAKVGDSLDPMVAKVIKSKGWDVFPNAQSVAAAAKTGIKSIAGGYITNDDENVAP